MHPPAWATGLIAASVARKMDETLTMVRLDVVILASGVVVSIDSGRGRG